MPWRPTWEGQFYFCISFEQELRRKVRAPEIPDLSSQTLRLVKIFSIFPFVIEYRTLSQELIFQTLTPTILKGKFTKETSLTKLIYLHKQISSLGILDQAIFRI